MDSRFALVATVALGLFGSSAQAQVSLGDAHVMVPLDDDFAESMDFGDVDGDGDVDVLIGNGPDQDLLYLNDGVGVFSDATANLPFDAEPTCAVALADFDGDGDLDAFLGTGFGGGANRLYANDGSAFFTDESNLLNPTDVDGTEDVGVADLDGDGFLDLMLANDGEGGGQQNRIYENDGTGAFFDVTSSKMPVDADATEGVALGDVDGDGDFDAFFANDSTQNRLYVNDGTGVFSDAAGVPVESSDSETVVMEDFDGDGDQDVLVGNSGIASRQNVLLRNDGMGVFTDDTASIPVDDDDTEGLAAGDVDGDGDVDVFVVNFLFPDRLYVNDGTGVFTDTTDPFPDLAVSTKAHLDDVDGDGDLDALVLYSGFENRLLLNDGSGLFREASRNFPGTPQRVRSVALADLDGDEDPDLVTGSQFGKCLFYRNNGAGFFAPGEGLLGTSETYAILAVDVEGDGDRDLILGRDLQDILLLNDGTGLFTGTAGLPAAIDATRALASGDVDEDGDVDVYMANLGQDGMLLNDGTGAFSGTTLPVDLDETRAAVLVDVDGDAHLDLLAGNGLTAGEANRLYLGDGTGSFVDASGGLPNDQHETGALAVGDVDLDGELDFVAGNGATRGEPNRVCLGDGTGSFVVSVAALPPFVEETASVALADLDEDGDLDLVQGNGVTTSQPNRALWNDGAGGFTESAGALLALAHRTSAIAVGDLDGDEDLDVTVAGDLSQSHVLTNFTRQLSWLGEPRLAKTLDMEISGEAGAPWFLAYSLSTLSAALTIPPYGELFLDPSSLVFVQAGALDGSGSAAVSLAIPLNPLAVGLDLPWQAVIVGGTVRLSNLERTVFTNL